MKRVLSVAMVLAGLALSGVAASGVTVEGKVNSYTCVVLGKACPVDHEDPVLAAENVFVVVRPDGTYFLIPNVRRDVLARQVNEEVRVTGTLEQKYHAVEANTVETYVAAKNDWKTVWSQAMEDEDRMIFEAPDRDGFFGHSMGHGHGRR